CYKVAMFHHENFDGTGYPLGISGESIPVEARILSIVDAYDALTMERCYRSAMSHSQALTVMENELIGKFDKNLLNIFLQNHMNFDTIRLIFKKFGDVDNMSNFYA
ncbi:HD domain-containing phosphohydrolase, partial [Gilvimarinus sp. SDUM040013]|uniref:HD-GYP domain-containing protein n=1 Tax=Gilvimarinus gilvus TaxID=3058038 RepID=UPI002672D828